MSPIYPNAPTSEDWESRATPPDPEVKDGMIVYTPEMHAFDAEYGWTTTRQLLSLADVENAIVGAIEEARDEQDFDWEPVNEGFLRLHKLALRRARLMARGGT